MTAFLQRHPSSAYLIWREWLQELYLPAEVNQQENHVQLLEILAVVRVV